MSKIIISIFILIIVLYSQVIKLNANDNTYINSSNIIYNEKENIIELSENSKINFNDINILIDKGVIDYNKNSFEVYGNFYLYEELNILSGNNLKGDNSLKFFTATDVNYIYNNDLKIDSTSVERKDNDIFFYDNFLTPCELDGFFDCPTWSLRIDKTKYAIEEDQFIHYDSFLQIADYKIFYLPYLSHYGKKAPRKKGFLTPTIEFALKGDTSIKTPYYFPLNVSSDILISPKISFDTNFQIYENYEQLTIFNKKTSGGKINSEIFNEFKQKDSHLYSSIKFNVNHTIDSNNYFELKTLFTNSISNTRSNNENPITFEDLFIKTHSYNFFTKNDYLTLSIKSVTAFDEVDFNKIPVYPSLKYHNVISINDHLYLTNQYDLNIGIRNDSDQDAASYKELHNLNNIFHSTINLSNFNIKNKIILNSQINSIKFNNDENLDQENFKSNLSISSNLLFDINSFQKIRTKFIISEEMTKVGKLNSNDNSRSFTFNYYNMFQEKRIFGTDSQDNSKRLVYGLENKLNIKNSLIKLNIGQTYDFDLDNYYLSNINQTDNFSDIAIDAEIKINNLNLHYNLRVDEERLSSIEESYSLEISKDNNFLIDLRYNETSKNAFKDLSSDNKSLKINLEKKINDHFSLLYANDLDLKNNYSPYRQSLGLILNDECSELFINYRKTSYNDNFNTSPEEIISISYKMDYLGFFGYEQKTNLFFSEPGAVDYGL